jgi:copper(I)-binding protein
MHKNNIGTALAALAFLFIVRTASAGIEISDARAVLAADAPRRVEISFTLHNTTTHELKLLKAVCAAGDSLQLKQRSYDADGRMRLWPVAKFEVPAGDSLHLSTTGRFFQLTGLAPSLRAGQPLPIVLTFEDEPPVTVDLTLEAAAQR